MKRASLLRLSPLLALALLLGALSLFRAAPAEANHAPDAVTNLAVVAAGIGEVYLDWTAPSGTVTGYEVHYTNAPASGSGAVGNNAPTGTSAEPARWWVDANYPSGRTTTLHTISGSSNEWYRVRVRPVNGDHAGPWAFARGWMLISPEATVSFQLDTVFVAETSQEEIVVRLSTALDRTVTVPVDAIPLGGRERGATEGADFDIPRKRHFRPGRNAEDRRGQRGRGHDE